LIQRTDDNEEVIRTRYLVFKNEIEPILSYYNAELICVNASQDQQVIFELISRELV
jgi:adenylate kinase family enzyme